ncbi:MAG TPA: hypothetical protein VEH77_06770, partial [Roseiarcus sp.]|nr:hypothetical protein [Roseiarcus sp.]
DVDEILRSALASEKAKLLHMLTDAAPVQRMALLEEIAACESLLGRLSQGGAPDRIRGGALQTEPPVEPKEHIDPFC